jgi:hypothetical protein
MARRGVDAPDFISDHCHPQSRAADQNAAIEIPVRNLTREIASNIRIIRRARAEHVEVLDFDTQRAKMLHQDTLQIKAGIVCVHCHSHANLPVQLVGSPQDSAHEGSSGFRTVYIIYNSGYGCVNRSVLQKTLSSGRRVGHAAVNRNRGASRRDRIRSEVEHRIRDIV